MISIFCIIAGFTCCCTSIAAELINHTKYKHLLRLRPDITIAVHNCRTTGTFNNSVITVNTRPIKHQTTFFKYKIN